MSESKKNNIIEFDSSRRRKKTVVPWERGIEHGPFFKRDESQKTSGSDALVEAKSEEARAVIDNPEPKNHRKVPEIGNVARIERIRSMIYDFDNPDMCKWNIWEGLFVEFIAKLGEMIEEEFEDFFPDLKSKDEYLKTGAYLINFFKNIYMMEEASILMILSQYKTIKSDWLKVDAFLFDILSHDIPNDAESVAEVEDLNEDLQKKIVLIEAQFLSLSKKTRLPIYRMISENIGIYIANLQMCEQVATLMQAANHYSQYLSDCEFSTLELIEDDD